MKDKSIAILIIIVIATAVAVGFVFWNNRNLPAETLIKIQREVNPCFGFSADSGEITCEEAKNIALKKYPGSIIEIKKKTLPYKTVDRKVWIFLIKPSDISTFSQLQEKLANTEIKNIQNIKTLAVVIDRSSKEILFLQIFPILQISPKK